MNRVLASFGTALALWMLALGCNGGAPSEEPASSDAIVSSDEADVRYAFHSSVRVASELGAVQRGELRGGFTMGPHDANGEAALKDVVFTLTLLPTVVGGMTLESLEMRGGIAPHGLSYVKTASRNEFFIEGIADVPADANHTVFGDTAGKKIRLALWPVCDLTYSSCSLGALTGFNRDDRSDHVDPDMRIEATETFVLNRSALMQP